MIDRVAVLIEFPVNYLEISFEREKNECSLSVGRYESSFFFFFLFLPSYFPRNAVTWISIGADIMQYGARKLVKTRHDPT